MIRVRIKAKRFKPTLYMSTPDRTAFLEAVTRQAPDRGLVLGNDKFRQKVKHLTGRRQRHFEPGSVAGFKSIKTEVFLL
jgi:hypothetical protein